MITNEPVIIPMRPLLLSKESLTAASRDLTRGDFEAFHEHLHIAARQLRSACRAEKAALGETGPINQELMGKSPNLNTVLPQLMGISRGTYISVKQHNGLFDLLEKVEQLITPNANPLVGAFFADAASLEKNNADPAEAASPWQPPVLTPEERVQILEGFLQGGDSCRVEISSYYTVGIERLNTKVATAPLQNIPQYRVTPIGEGPSFVVLSTGEAHCSHRFHGSGIIFLRPVRSNEAGPYLTWIDSVLDDLKINGRKV